MHQIASSRNVTRIAADMGLAYAAERGRLMAAEAMRVNPEARERVERAYGKEWTMHRYPEAYPQKYGKGA